MGAKGASWMSPISFSRSSSSTAKNTLMVSLWLLGLWISFLNARGFSRPASFSRMSSIFSCTGNSCRGITGSSSGREGNSAARARSRSARAYRFTFIVFFVTGSGFRATRRLASCRHSRRAAAWRFVFWYSTSMSTSICRGSASSSSSSSGSFGSSIRLLICSRRAAMSRNSLATSRSYSCMAFR